MPFLVLFSVAVMSQLFSSANANPNWVWPWEDTLPSTYQEVTVVSPVWGGSYSSNDVWLNITVTTPSWLNTTHYKIKSIFYVVYVVNIDNPDSKKMEVRDTLDVAGAPYSFNFSVNVAGLKDGAHTLWYRLNGVDWDHEFNPGAFIDFTVYTLKPEPFPTSLVATASGFSAAVIGLGLLVYFKKRKH
jgi:hypothetical protein